MNKIAGWIITLALGAAAGLALWKSPPSSPAPAQAAEAGAPAAQSAAAVQGFYALDVEPLLKDPQMQELLASRGIVLDASRIGSRQMADKLASKPDFLFASGTVAAADIQEKAKAMGLAPQSASPFHTPLMIASWTQAAAALEAAGAARLKTKGKVPVYEADMAVLLRLMESQKKWSDLPGNGWKSGKSILVSTTDPRQSNSAAMYLALMAAAANNGENPQSAQASGALGKRIAPLFKRQGYQENYVNGAFDDWAMIGIGKAPMVFVYESQLIERAIKDGALPDNAAILLPKPTIANKETFVALTERGRALLEALQTPQAAAIAAKYGLRGNDPKAFASALAAAGIPADSRISEIADPPQASAMNEMLRAAAQELSQ